MFKSAIEGESREHDTAEDVVDHVKSTVCFEVDGDALQYDLNHLDGGETLVLRNDCMIYKYEAL